MTGYHSVDTLAHLLTDQYKSEADKVASIVRWMAAHISYDIQGYYHLDSIYKSIQYSGNDNDYNICKANFVIRKHKGICDGYATLFKVLCDYAGVKSEIITGYAKRTEKEIGVTFLPNHAWNAVSIDSKWYLVDVTWASGYVDDGVTKFTRAYNGYYYCTPPERLIFIHYPTDVKWTLLSKPPSLYDFYVSPVVLYGYQVFEINSFLPEKGIIEAHVGDTILLELETKEKHKALGAIDNLDKMVMTGYDDPEIKNPYLLIIPQAQENIPLDTLAIKLIEKEITSQDRQFSDDIMGYVNSVEDNDTAYMEKPIARDDKPKVNSNIKGDKIFLKYVVRSVKAKELTLEYNYYPVLKYKLKIKPRK